MKSPKISFRNLWKHRNASIVNLIGLTTAITSIIFILIWIHHELSFDKHNDNYENIFMVASEWKYSDGKSDFIMETPMPLGPYLKENIPEVIQSTRFEKQFGGRFLEVEGKKFLEQGFAIEPSFFEVFTVDMKVGEAGAIATHPNSILISQRLADKFFGNTDPLNKSISFFVDTDEKREYEIYGVYETIQDNSSLQFDFLIPNSLNEPNNWYAFGESTFVLLPDEVDQINFEEKISQFYDYENLGFDIEWYLHPLKDMHFHSDFQQFVYHPGSIQYVYIFSIAAIFIFIIAVLNFSSFVSVWIANRQKETGLKKILGASKYEIVVSILTEPFILVLISLLGSFLLFNSFRSLFSQFSENPNIGFHQNGFIISALIGMGLLIAIIVGIFSFGLIVNFSRSNEFRLKKLAIGRGFKRFLIVSQFTLALVLMSSTFLIYKQLTFIFNKDLGYTKENVIHVPLKGKMGENYSIIKEQLLTNSKIENITNTSPMIKSGVETPGWTWEGIDKEDKHSIAIVRADADFINTFDLELLLGEDFSTETSNQNKVIINEEAAEIMGLGNPISKSVQLKDETYEVIGVVKNFHSRHFSHKIRPLMISYGTDTHDLYIHYKNDKDKAEIISLVKNEYQNYVAEFPFEYYFFSEEFTATYRDENKMLKLLSYFVAVAFLILSLGLYGLSKQMALSRTKEIGIRKINGAKISEIMVLLNRDFVKWVCIAFGIAVPISYYLMHTWLENFAYKTAISWWIFAATGLLAMVVALLTISWQSWRAATRNPIDVLRYE